VTPEEVKDAILRAGIASPGADNITVKYYVRPGAPSLNTSAPSFGDAYQQAVTQKFSAKLKSVMIPKPGRRDLTSPRS
jgi:hypothetical protein